MSCTGSATQTGVGTATIASVKVTLVPAGAAVDNPPLQEDNTCAGLLAGNQPGDVAATYGTTIKFKTTGAKMADATTTGQGIAPAGIGFAVSGGTVGGSLAGGNGKTQANLADGGTLAAVTAPAATSTAPNPNITCEANLQLKAATPSKPASAKLKKPKGLKKILIGQSFADPTPAGASTLCLRKGSTCP